MYVAPPPPATQILPASPPPVRDLSALLRMGGWAAQSDDLTVDRLKVLLYGGWNACDDLERLLAERAELAEERERDAKTDVLAEERQPDAVARQRRRVVWNDSLRAASLSTTACLHLRINLPAPSARACKRWPASTTTNALIKDLRDDQAQRRRATERAAQAHSDLVKRRDEQGPRRQ